MIRKHELDIPDFLKIPTAERAQYWRENPPVPVAYSMAPTLAPEKIAFKEQEAKEKMIRTQNRIAKLRAKQAARDIPDKYLAWDTTHCKFIDIRKKHQPSTPAPAQASSKQERVMQMLQKGASINEIVAETGWKPHSTRAFFTSVRKKHSLLHTVDANGVRRYRLD